MFTREKIEALRSKLTPEQLAVLEKRLRGEGGEVEEAGNAAGAIPRRAPGEEAPLSFAQQRLWFLEHLTPGTAVFNVPAAVRLTGHLDLAALAGALAAVAARHETLRTRFVEEDGRPRAVIEPPPAIPPLAAVDLTALSDQERQALVERLARHHARRPFDLSHPPLLRALLLRLGNRPVGSDPATAEAPGPSERPEGPAGQDEHVLLLNVHHIAADHHSLGVLFGELAALYRARAAGRPDPLPELPIQYGDFALWQRRRLAGERLDELLAYWRRRLDGSPRVLELPTDRPRPAVPSFQGRSLSFALEPAAVARLKALGRRREASLFMTLLAAFQLLLGRLSGQHDVVVGSPIAGREREELQGLIGLLISNLVLRADVGDDPSFETHLDRSRETALGAYQHQEIPFERLVDQLARERHLSHTPLFQVAFQLLHQERQEWHLGELTMEEMALETGAAQFDLTLHLLEKEGHEGVAGWFDYAADLFDATTVARFGRHYTALLEAIAAHPERPVSTLPWFGAQERLQLTAEWNDTLAPLPAGTLHGLFFQQAEAVPEAVAVAFPGDGEESCLSYRELARRARRLARRLRRLGAGPGGYVGVYLRRGSEMAEALLGILAAGAAYAPLERRWPAERLRYVLDALEVGVLVTDRAGLTTAWGLQWRLPRLADLVCLDVTSPEPPSEELDPAAVAGVWDLVAERAVDRVSAGGFVSSYTGEPFSEAEVDEYVERVMTLAAPHLTPDARVLEIGCGAGLLLAALAPRAGRLVGLDPSPRSLGLARRRLEGLDGGDRVELVEGFAHQAVAKTQGPFDLVVIASTVQFFPGPLYLERVLTSALGLLAPGGALLVADLLDPRQREDFQRSLDEHRRRHPEAAASAQGGRHRPGSTLEVDEAYLHGFAAQRPEVAAVQVHHRSEGFPNELRFRYDALLTGATREHPTPPPEKRLWTAWHLEGDGPDAQGAGAHARLDPGGQAAGHPPSRGLCDGALLNRVEDTTHPAPAQRRSEPDADSPLSSLRPLEGDGPDAQGGGSYASGGASGPEDTAYVIFTSGSTGLPKGVVVRHRPAVHLVRWVNRRFGIGPGDRLLFITSLCFDLSVYDLFGTLAAGGTVQVASDADLADPARLATALLRHPVTFWDSAPAALQQLVPLLGDGPGPGSHRLRTVFLSGDWIPLSLPGAVRRVFPGARVIALGGATEATVWSNLFPVGEISSHWVSIPYGRPIPNARYYVLDGHLEPCPPGVAGDLWIGGECLCDGYAGEATQTAASFLPDPFYPRAAGAAGAGGRIYRTGDRARFRPDGLLEFLGRLDAQVKLRGYRIELGEIESLLDRHPAVEKAAALVHEGRRLVAYAVPREGLEAGGDDGEPAEPARHSLAETLRAYLEEHLPDYMIPGAFLFLDRLPVTANGKLDRGALPAPGEAEAGRRPPFVPPATPEEVALARIWSQVLGVERVGLGDNFFALGGDSILSVEIVARARREGLALSPRDLFQHQTLGSLAARASAEAEGSEEAEAGDGGEKSSAEPWEPHDLEALGRFLPAGRRVVDAYPLAPFQSAMLARYRERDEPGLFWISLDFEIRGMEVDPDRFRRAWQAVVDHHPILRTSFAWQDLDEPLQLVWDTAAIQLTAGDWRDRTRERQLALLQAYFDDRIRQGIPLTGAPHTQLGLFRTAESTWIFAWTINLMLQDGWSFPVLLGDFLAAYDALDEGREPRLAEAESRYRKFVALTRRLERGAAEAYWRSTLEGFRRPTPVLAALGGGDPGAGRREVVKLPRELPGEVKEALAELSARHKVTLYTLAAAAWALQLHHYTGHRDVLFGIWVNTRPVERLAGAERMAGNFLNFLPLRLQVDPERPLVPWLEEIQGRLLDLRRFDFTPPDWIKASSELPPELPLYDSYLVFEHFPIAESLRERAQRGEMEFIYRDVGRTGVPLRLEVHPIEGLMLLLQHYPRQLAPAGAERALDDFAALLRELAASVGHPRRPAGSLLEALSSQISAGTPR